MPLEVRLSATLRLLLPGYDSQAGLAPPWRPGLTVAGLLADLGIPAAQVKIVMLNGRSAGLETPLAEGDRLGFFPAVGGG